MSSSSNWKDLPVLRDQALSQDLKEIEKWSGANNMYVNVTKTKAMLAIGKRLRKRFVQWFKTLQSYSSVSIAKKSN